MKKTVVLLLAVIRFNDSFCQEEKPVVVVPPSATEKGTIRVVQDVVEFPDVEAEFAGGKDSLQAYILNNVAYPKDAISKNIQGKVFISFIVEMDGVVSNVKVVKSAGPDLDNEAKRLIRSMPKWIPGEYNGQVCRTRRIIPVNFALTANK